MFGCTKASQHEVNKLMLCILLKHNLLSALYRTKPWTGNHICLSRSSVYQHMHPCVSDLRFLYGDFLFCYSFTALYRGRGGTVSSKGLSSRHISSHLKTYGLSKCSEDICDEVDLLLCRGCELNIYFFSLLTTTKWINDWERSHDICQKRLLMQRVVFSTCTSAWTSYSAKLVFCVLCYG